MASLARVFWMNLADDNSSLNVKDVQHRFDRAASRFDGTDFVHSFARDGLFARLKPIVVKARTVIDLGSATGASTQGLSKQFRRARIIEVDLSHNMLQQGRRKQTWFSKTASIQANANALPFADQSVDVVFSNLLLPWIDDPVTFFSEMARVLRKDGLLIFSTVGPDSLMELRRAWEKVDAHAHVNRFLDMHDIGDKAVQAGLRDPVLDVDRLTVTYESANALFRDLTAIGARNSLRLRNPSMLGRSRFAEMTAALDACRKDGLLTLDLELVYGHCWGCGPRADSGDYRIDANRISHRVR